MSKFYDHVEEYVLEAFAEHPIHKTTAKHLVNTVDWVKTLDPHADEAMLIAALSHDLERAFADKKIDVVFNDPKYLDFHQKKSADAISDFLKKELAPKAMIKRVYEMVLKHEMGGTEEQNLIKDADSLSFFDRDMNNFINKYKDDGKDRIKAKFDWMYDRITSEKAKKLAAPMYERALKALEKV